MRKFIILFGIVVFFCCGFINCSEFPKDNSSFVIIEIETYRFHNVENKCIYKNADDDYFLATCNKFNIGDTVYIIYTKCSTK